MQLVRAAALSFGSKYNISPVEKNGRNGFGIRYEIQDPGVKKTPDLGRIRIRNTVNMTS
jgi:hypothetical protein